MLTTLQLNRYAQVLLWGLQKARGKSLGSGEAVLVRFDRSAMDLAATVQAHLLRIGANPILRLNLWPEAERDFYDLAQEQQLRFLAPGDEELMQGISGLISLLGPESLNHLQGVDPKRISMALTARKKLRDIMSEREVRGECSWTLCLHPTKELAKQAGMSEQEYADQIVGACFLDESDPVGKWEQVFEDISAIRARLSSLDAKAYRIRAERIDLRIPAGAHRRWIGISGHNIPSFEVFTSPDWREVSGTFFADQPSFRSGNVVKGVRLVFEKGRVVECSAEEGEAFLIQQLEMDAGAGRVGEFSLTDRRFSRISRFMAHTLFDENFGGSFGNCHIAVGASYPETFSGDPSSLTSERKKGLGFNDSALHWDLVNTEAKEVTAELSTGREILIYRDGVFFPSMDI